MFKTPRAFFLLLLAGFTVAGIPSGAFSFQQGRETKKGIEAVAWLQGTWFSNDSSEIVEEQWLKPRGGMMLGVNRTVPKTGKPAFEFMRIAETPEGLTFFASPAGKPATPFQAVELEDKQVVFENPKNEFPRRIRYRRDGETLQASIEGVLQGKTMKMEWKWRLEK